MSGVGALHFALSTYKKQFHFFISEILCLDSNSKVLVFSELDRLYSFGNKHLIALPIFLVGGAILYFCGYPMIAFPKYYLWVTSSVMFYVGGLMFAYALYSLKVFYALEENVQNISLQENVNIIELENFNLYLTILFFASTIALYFAFRGTLSANFTFLPPHEWVKNLISLFLPTKSEYSLLRNLLIYPIVIFLPLSLFAGFYMKLVIRKIYLNDIRMKLREIDQLTKPAIEQVRSDNIELNIIEVRKTALELKEKIVQDNKVFPLITLKDTPSIALLLVVILQFIWLNDDLIQEFFNGISNIIN